MSDLIDSALRQWADEQLASTTESLPIPILTSAGSSHLRRRIGATAAAAAVVIAVVVAFIVVPHRHTQHRLPVVAAPCAGAFRASSAQVLQAGMSLLAYVDLAYGGSGTCQINLDPPDVVLVATGRPLTALPAAGATGRRAAVRDGDVVTVTVLNLECSRATERMTLQITLRGNGQPMRPVTAPADLRGWTAATCNNAAATAAPSAVNEWQAAPLLTRPQPRQGSGAAGIGTTWRLIRLQSADRTFAVDNGGTITRTAGGAIEINDGVNTLTTSSVRTASGFRTSETANSTALGGPNWLVNAPPPLQYVMANNAMDSIVGSDVIAQLSGRNLVLATRDYVMLLEPVS